MLSRHPITRSAGTIYRTCVGFDCAANKGILYGRMQPPSGPAYDAFLTHMQNANAEEGGRSA